MKFLVFLGNTLIFIQPWAKYFAPFIAGFALFAANQAEKSKELWLRIGLLAIFLCVVNWGAFNVLIQPKLAGYMDAFPVSDLVISFLIFLLGLSAYFAWLREGQPWWNTQAQQLTKKTTLERNKKTDVRNIDEFLPESFEYNPEQFFNDQKGVFVGLDEKKLPVYIGWNDFNESHILLSGRTRIGKGVAAQIILSQAIKNKNAVVVLDPKSDEWMPHLFFTACKKYGQPYLLMNLNQFAGPQINPLYGAATHELENIIISTCGIDEKGDIADHYRLADRAAARDLAKWLSENPGSTLASGFNALGNNWVDKAAGFHSYIKELADLPSINAKSSLNLEDFVKEGGCLYVIGDMSNSRILRAQRMILLRLMMIAKNRLKTADTRTITVFADEFKAHISKPFVTSLGAAAGWGMQTMLAFQSFADLEDMPKDLDKNAVKGAVIENCAISISYAIKDPVTADFISEMTGEILVDDEVRKVSKNAGLAEVVDDSRQIRQAERNLYDRNMVMKLKKGSAILNVSGQLAKAIHISKIKVDKTPEALKLDIKPGDSIITAAELI